MNNQIFQKFLLAITAVTVSVFFAPNLLAQDYSAGKNSPGVAQSAKGRQEHASIILRHSANIATCTRENKRQHDYCLYPEFRYGL